MPAKRDKGDTMLDAYLYVRGVILTTEDQQQGGVIQL